MERATESYVREKSYRASVATVLAKIIDGRVLPQYPLRYGTDFRVVLDFLIMYSEKKLIVLKGFLRERLRTLLGKYIVAYM